MNDLIEALNSEEQDIVYKAPLLVTILIAGADDNIDSSEKESAVLSTNFNYQTFVVEPEFDKFYEKVSYGFVEKLHELIEELPKKATNRNPKISDELVKLNPVLPKLGNEYGQLYYESLLALAKNVAKASGGVLGVGSISGVEQVWVNLPMLTNPS